MKKILFSAALAVMAAISGGCAAATASVSDADRATPDNENTARQTIHTFLTALYRGQSAVVADNSARPLYFNKKDPVQDTKDIQSLVRVGYESMLQAQHASSMQPQVVPSGGPDVRQGSTTGVTAIAEPVVEIQSTDFMTWDAFKTKDASKELASWIEGKADPAHAFAQVELTVSKGPPRTIGLWLIKDGDSWKVAGFQSS
ncbi:MAG: hypothetical protein GMKNLPBB_02847 [Myxococcota bacterium]|nr:hypothetical protein [Myxococcota bacterium]